MARIKLDGLRFNNIDLSIGVPDHHKAAVAACAAKAPKKFAVTADAAVAVAADLYIAQHNFVDLEPVAAFGTGNAVPILPGQPMAPYLPPFETLPTIAHVSGANVADLINAATAEHDEGGLWTATTGVSAGFMSSFTRNNAVYQSVGETTIIGGNVMRWRGWGIMYFTGLYRPSRFEQYPQLSILQMPVVAGNQIFTIDFAKTEIIFEVNPNGEVELIHGEYVK